ncbi:Hypothetical protein CINCED_3A007234 [Cinara cedri]|uniref:Protein kinase domain-containing protein n=1 Tax=Cinara cedri TaxID=506608 RepID=A0A5E4NMT8_9HEMI|nr:Hypothetical protein CINCED_3A007234 [Cinara cedri]
MPFGRGGVIAEKAYKKKKNKSCGLFFSYLHSCSPPIIHGNLTCDTIFIQHNGLVKIGSVAPDTIHVHIKTCRENMKNMHFIAPECGNFVTPAIDIYAFGMCALEMASLEIQGNGDSGTLVTQDHINRTIESLDDPLQKDLIYQCLTADFEKRPSARTLLFHPVLFEVHGLKLLAAHALVKTEHFADRLSDEVYPQEKVMAEITHPDETRCVQYKMSDVPESNKLEKFVEDVRFGIYPLTAYALEAGPVRLTTYQPQSPTGSMDQSIPSDRSSIGPIDVEVRRIVNMMCNIKPRDDAQNDFMMTILLRMDDKMNRQLTCSITDADTALSLSQELVHFGFINEADKDKIFVIIEETLSEGPQYKEDGQSSVLVDHDIISPSKLQKQPSVNTVGGSAALSSLRPSVIRSPIKRDGS